MKMLDHKQNTVTTTNHKKSRKIMIGGLKLSRTIFGLDWEYNQK